MKRRAPGVMAARGRVGRAGGPPRLLVMALGGVLLLLYRDVAAWAFHPSSPLRASSPAAFRLPARRGRTLRAALTLGGNGEAGQGGQDGSSMVSARLQKARLRLAEAQGIIPAGSSDRYQSPGGIQVRDRQTHTPHLLPYCRIGCRTPCRPNTSVGLNPRPYTPSHKSHSPTQRTTKVRDLTFKVAEPEVQYDPEEAESRLWRQPVRWLRRNVDLFVPLTAFLTRVILDIVTEQEEKVRGFVVGLMDGWMGVGRLRRQIV